jgi:hypothetical protein
MMTGMSSLIDDLALFRDDHNAELAKLVESNPSGPTAILSDKGSIGFRDPTLLRRRTLHTKRARGVLTPRNTHENTTLSSHRGGTVHSDFDLVDGANAVVSEIRNLQEIERNGRTNTRIAMALDEDKCCFEV